MLPLEAYYLPPDRLQALAAHLSLPHTVNGSVLFADIAGFTPITERLRMILGARRGAEQLTSYLNQVYDALINEVEHYGGAIIGFAGDSFTCWFGGESFAVRAAACGFALLDAMNTVDQIALLDGDTVRLGLKVAISSGMIKRFVVGDPDIQLIDTVAGATVTRLAVGEALAQSGDLIADSSTVERLGKLAEVREWRDSESERFAVLARFEQPPNLRSTPLERVSPSGERLHSWLLPALVRHLQAGIGEFQIELRPVTALFLRFSGIDYDADVRAEDKLNRLVRQIQVIVNRYDGSVLQLTIGDKGSYLYATFGAPVAHEDDTSRAFSAALDIRETIEQGGDIDPVQIGISRGIMRAGAYGGLTRRTYGVLGDNVNLAARLMTQAQPGDILLSESALVTKLDGFTLESLSPIKVKGKANPIQIFRLTGRRERSFEDRFYTTPLVGRDNELKKLQEAAIPLLERRHAGVVYIYGEPGIGKSRLAFEMRQRLEAEASITWLMGQGEALNRAPLGSFAYFLRPYFGQRREWDTADNLSAFTTVFESLLALSDEMNRADLLLYRSYLAGLIGLVIPGSPYETADEKLRLDNRIAALKAWARAESRRQPLVLHLEDAQWLDASSIVAVQQLTYSMDNVPLMLLLTSRYKDDGTPYIIPNIFGVLVHAFDLNRLSDDGVRVVSEAVLNGVISEGLAQFVRERADGNPFFTEQLVLDLKERSALDNVEGVWNLRTDIATEVPSGVNGVLIARLDRLAGRVKAVVQTAAVLGREFDVMVLSRMLREDDHAFIREAEREAIWSSLDKLRYLFRHVLLRDAAYDMQAQERLKELHRVAAETIEMLYSEDERQAEALLEHWHAAGDLQRELPYLDKVAKRLLEIDGRYAEAEQLVNRALGQLDEGDTQRVRLLNRLSSSFHNRGDYATAIVPALEAQHLAERLHDQLGLSLSLTNLGQIAWRQGNSAEARAYYERSLAIRRELGDRAGIANCLRDMGIVSYSEGSYVEARAYFEQSLAIHREIGNLQGICRCLNTLGAIAQEQGAYKEAQATWLQSLTIAREIGDRANIASNLTNLGVVVLDMGLHDEAQSYHEQALTMAREMGNRRSIAIALSNLGNVALEREKYQEAHAYFDQALTLYREMGIQQFLTLALVMQGIVSLVQGEHKEARTYFEQSLPIQQQIGDRYGTAISLSYFGVIAFYEGDYRGAESYQRQALTIRRETQDHFVHTSLAWLARIQFRLGQVDHGRETLRESVMIIQTYPARQKLEVLLPAVEWHIASNRLETGVELVGLILRHPKVDTETRVNTRELLELIRPRLDAAALDIAFEYGQSLDLDTVIEQLLVELG